MSAAVTAHVVLLTFDLMIPFLHSLSARCLNTRHLVRGPSAIDRLVGGSAGLRLFAARRDWL